MPMPTSSRDNQRVNRQLRDLNREEPSEEYPSPMENNEEEQGLDSMTEEEDDSTGNFTN